jgi:pimeloyl-ACP methyl ester carboxylesterase
MRRWRNAIAAWVALLVSGYIIPRYVWLRRRRLPSGVQYLDTVDAGRLAVSHIRRGHPHLVVVVHGLFKSMNDAQIAAFTRKLEPHFDILVFDLPGHGKSSGETDLSYALAAEAVREVLGYACTLGYSRIGLVGYSMGAAAAIIAVAKGAPVDALVSVSCPSSAIVERGVGAHLYHWPLRAWLWLLGTRVASHVGTEVGPAVYMAALAPVPLLLVHDGLDTLVSRKESEALFAAAMAPKDWLYVPGAPHAWPMASARGVIAWLETNMCEESVI